jgi:hypothetical protein
VEVFRRNAEGLWVLHPYGNDDCIALTSIGWEGAIIELTYPVLGSIGQVGEVLISAISGILISASKVEDIKITGIALFNSRENDIQAVIL